MVVDNLNIKKNNIQTTFNLLKRNKLDTIFLVSCNKNPYIIDYFKTRFSNILGTDGINDAIIKKKYGKYPKTKINNDEYTKSHFLKKQNIIRSESINILNNKQKIINSISTRVIIVARKDVPHDYILKLLRNIYGNITKLKLILNNYLYTPMRNNNMKLLDPIDMCYINQPIKYHSGSYDFFTEIGLITKKEPKKKTIFDKFI